MGNGHPILLYYDIVLALSVILTGVYMFRWQKHDDVHITLVFVLVPVINLGYALIAHSSELREAVAANKLAYLGGCYLELNILLIVCALCEIRVHRLVKLLLFTASTFIYLFVLQTGFSDTFYSSVALSFTGGLAQLEKQYGWMHTVSQYMVIGYFLASLSVIAYSLIRKNQISRKILLLLFLPEVVAMAAFFGGRSLTREIELLPFAYLTAQVVYLIIVSRISLYNVADTAVESLSRTGETGFISIDDGLHYLGSNEAARQFFPQLRHMTVDFSIQRSKSFSERIIPWLSAYGEDRSNNTFHFRQGGQVYQVSVAPLINRRREKGYQLTITDDTQDQNYIEKIEAEVARQTAHIVEMHDQLIMSMATMVESRDNSTGGHIRRTREGVRILLDVISRQGTPKLTDSFRKKLIKAAPMHDLGKIAVDDAVLRKPGRFTPEEFEKMKAHAAEGARIVHTILKGTDDDEFHMIAENVANFHHERWDGSGYPQKLKGEAIPLEARIMAVADVYDALVSKRVYKDRMSFEQADRIMLEGMGTQFAPEMETVYRRARPKLEAYYASLSEDEKA